jgi:hypothetical protein
VIARERLRGSKIDEVGGEVGAEELKWRGGRPVNVHDPEN